MITASRVIMKGLHYCRTPVDSSEVGTRVTHKNKLERRVAVFMCSKAFTGLGRHAAWLQHMCRMRVGVRCVVNWAQLNLHRSTPTSGSEHLSMFGEAYLGLIRHNAFFLCYCVGVLSAF